MTALEWFKLKGEDRCRDDLQIVLKHGFNSFYTPTFVVELIELVNK